MNNTNTFEDYLKDVHEKDYHGTDDEMLDAFNAWVERLDASEILQYAEDCVAELNARIKTLMPSMGAKT
jgi:hypothetical protein